MIDPPSSRVLRKLELLLPGEACSLTVPTGCPRLNLHKQNTKRGTRSARGVAHHASAVCDDEVALIRYLMLDAVR
jgi:hypothetical protein